MSLPKIFLCGKLRSGKSAAADHLRFHYGFSEIAFGGMLKFYAEKVFVHSDVIKGGKPRALFQQFGELCREIDPQVWVQHADFAYKMALDCRATQGIVISDGRQPHEYEWARSNGFIVVKIEAPDELRIERAKQAGDNFEPAHLAHETEQYVDGFAADYTIENSGSLADLRANLDAIMSEIMTQKGSYAY